MTALVPALVATLGAAPLQLAIVEVDAADAMTGLAGQVTRALLESAKAQQLSVIDPDAVRGALSEAKYQTLRRCGGAPACVAEYAPALGVTRVVLGSLSRDDRHYLLKLWLIDTERLDVVADVDRKVLIAGRRLQRDVEQAVPPLLRGEREARGTLAISCAVPNAQISVNGEALGPAPVELQLKPGKHTIRVEKPKYLTVNRLVTVEANQRTDENVRLLLTPGEVDEDVPLPGLPREPGPAVETHSAGASVVTWVLGGLAVAALGTGAVFGLQARAADEALTRGFQQPTGLYAGTRRDALTAQSQALTANVAFGAAGALAVASGLSLILDLKGSSEPVQVAASANMAGAGVVVRGAF